MRWPWSKKTLPAAVKEEPVDSHTYHFGAKASENLNAILKELDKMKPKRKPHDVFVRYVSPADRLFPKSFTNLAARDIEDARDMAQRGRRKFAMGDSKICPIVVVRVYWKGAIKTMIENR